MNTLKLASAKLWFSIAAIAFVIDQVSKQLAQHYLELMQAVPVVEHFNLYLIYNTGAAFSLLSEAGGWQRWFLILVTATVCVVLIAWIKNLKGNEKKEGFALALILGGALGNLSDRLIYGHVIDFLDVYYEQYHWPIFNIADMCVSVGALLVVLLIFKSDDEPQRDKTT